MNPNLRLRVVQANYGDCLILEADLSNGTHYFLMDGGPDGIYASHLKPELQEIAKQKGSLDLVILSHVDEDHVVGLVDMMAEIAQAQESSGKPVIEVGEIWYNTFRPDNSGSEAQVAPFLDYLSSTFAGGSLQSVAFSISQGEDLWKASQILDIPLNTQFTKRVIQVESAPQPIEMEDLKLWVIGPLQKNLERYHRNWDKWYEKHKNDPFTSSAVREANQIDRSVSNRSSIMLLAEASGRRILLTGDGHSVDVLTGLEQVGLVSPGQTLHLDVLKVPHHGSSRNSNQDFYATISADTYVISAGKHKNDNNPDLKTLVWIVKAAHKRGKPVEILVTNPNDSTSKLIEEYPPDQYGYALQVLCPGTHSIVV